MAFFGCYVTSTSGVCTAYDDDDAKKKQNPFHITLFRPSYEFMEHRNLNLTRQSTLIHAKHKISVTFTLHEGLSFELWVRNRKSEILVVISGFGAPGRKVLQTVENCEKLHSAPTFSSSSLVRRKVLVSFWWFVTLLDFWSLAYNCFGAMNNYTCMSIVDVMLATVRSPLAIEIPIGKSSVHYSCHLLSLVAMNESFFLLNFNIIVYFFSLMKIPNKIIYLFAFSYKFHTFL